MAFTINNSKIVFNLSTLVTGFPFSLLGWFRVLDDTSPASFLGVKGSSPTSHFSLQFDGGATKAAVAKAESGSTGAAYSSSPMIEGTWHHLVAVFASETQRTIYLDGGNTGVNTDSVPATSWSFSYFGNLENSTLVDLAEVAIADVEVSAEQASILASGCSVLSTSLAKNAVAYHDCIRQLNRPGLGPAFLSAGPTVADHPPIFSSTGGVSPLMPLRYGGPWQTEQAEFRPMSAEIGQHAVAGVGVSNSILSGEVLS